MRTRWERLGALALGLGLMIGGFLSVGAASAAPVSTSRAPTALHIRGGGLSAPALCGLGEQPPSGPAVCAENQKDDAAEGDTGTEADDPNDTDDIQDENGADDATENPSDTDNVQCGDQNEDAAGGQASDQQAMTGGTQQVSFLRAQTQTESQATDGTEAANGAEPENGTETETGGDEAIDGIQCEQQGENEGENAGC